MHHALYFERILRSGNLGFGVAGVTQRSGGGADVMNSQDSLYSINECEGAWFSAIILGAIRKAYCFPRLVNMYCRLREANIVNWLP